MKTPHPTLGDWMDWVRDQLSPPQAERMRRHMRTCVTCAPRWPMLDQLQSARRFRRWQTPDESLKRRVPRLRHAPKTPPTPRTTREMQWKSADIRDLSLVSASQPDVLNAVVAAGEVSISAHPPQDDPYWTIEGRVWLREEQDAAIDVVAVAEDHVVVHRQVSDGEFFQIREILPPRWELEVHLPDDTLKLSDGS